MAAQLHDVGGFAHERQGDEVDAVLEHAGEVVEVLLRQASGADLAAGQVDALELVQHATVDDARVDLGAVDAQHLDLEVAVVEEDALADLHVLGQAAVAGADAHRAVGLQFADNAGGDVDADVGAAFQVDRLGVAQAADADLRPLQVGEDADGTVLFGGDATDAGDRVGDRRVVRVRTVDAEHVRAGLHEGGDHRVLVGSGSEGRDDLRAVVPRHAGNSRIGGAHASRSRGTVRGREL